MTTHPEKRDLVVVRVFDAPLERVWRAWSDPEDVKLWWEPERFTCPVARMDFRVGGTSLVCMRAPREFMGGRDMYTTWTYETIVPTRRIAYILRFADEDGTTRDPKTLGLPSCRRKRVTRSRSTDWRPTGRR